MLYRITARVSNRPNGDWRYRTDLPTFYLHAMSAQYAAEMAQAMIADLVRQDMSSGARVHVEAVDDETSSDYAAV